MTIQNATTVIHHEEDKPTRTSVVFDLHEHDTNPVGQPWGVLRIEVKTSDGNGGNHFTNLTHIIVGEDWREKAAAIRQAFRSATLLPNP